MVVLVYHSLTHPMTRAARPGRFQPSRGGGNSIGDRFPLAAGPQRVSSRECGSAMAACVTQLRFVSNNNESNDLTAPLFPKTKHVCPARRSGTQAHVRWRFGTGISYQVWCLCLNAACRHAAALHQKVVRVARTRWLRSGRAARSLMQGPLGASGGIDYGTTGQRDCGAKAEVSLKVEPVRSAMSAR